MWLSCILGARTTFTEKLHTFVCRQNINLYWRQRLSQHHKNDVCILLIICGVLRRSAISHWRDQAAHSGGTNLFGDFCLVKCPLTVTAAFIARVNVQEFAEHTDSPDLISNLVTQFHGFSSDIDSCHTGGLLLVCHINGSVATWYWFCRC